MHKRQVQLVQTFELTHHFCLNVGRYDANTVISHCSCENFKWFIKQDCSLLDSYPKSSKEPITQMQQSLCPYF